MDEDTEKEMYMLTTLWCLFWHSARNVVIEHRDECTVQHYDILVPSRADSLLGRLLGVSLHHSVSPL